MQTQRQDPYPPREAWYRSSEWDEDAQAEFARRLARARPDNRPQYRRIKAIALIGSPDATKRAAAQALLEQNLDAGDTADFEKVFALNVLSRHERTAGRIDDAERHLREILALVGPDGNGVNGEEEIRLAEILIEQGGPRQIAEAKELLDRRASDMPLFIKSRFRLCVAQARAARVLGIDESADWAEAALRLERETRSGLAKHPTLGLVETDAETLAWLRELALGGRSGHVSG